MVISLISPWQGMKKGTYLSVNSDFGYRVSPSICPANPRNDLTFEAKKDTFYRLKRLKDASKEWNFHISFILFYLIMTKKTNNEVYFIQHAERTCWCIQRTSRSRFAGRWKPMHNPIVLCESFARKRYVWSERRPNFFLSLPLNKQQMVCRPHYKKTRESY
jgi:hypothetical protein